MQALMAYLDLVVFMLKHGDQRTVFEKRRVFLLIADIVLLIMEDESEFFDKCFERSKWVPGPNVTLSKLTKQYCKMERMYLYQNKDYDPYSNTMHTHQLLNKQYFEVNMQSKEERVRAEIVELEKRHKEQSSKIFRLSTSLSTWDELNEEATQDLTNWEKRD